MKDWVVLGGSVYIFREEKGKIFLKKAVINFGG